ncbi:DUF3800 domain-containing protein [Methylobacterium indicum]|uniref:DUF3800 domain-containing protein n=1 Tax=Methylobacterium indicum TaxID=1775910 RepID=UPI0009E7B703|nr:DUF3800 domain-containing protein [Methylobacterium indicum]
MYLLYLDDSGDVDDPKINHFVLGGVAIFERQTHWIGKELDAIAARFDPADPAAVELHGNPMVQGNRGWKAFSQNDRITAIQDSLRVFERVHTKNKAFAVVIEKGSVKDKDPVEHAFELLINRFDRYLQKLHRQGDTQRGLLVMDKSSYENRFQGLARNFRDNGHSWGQLRNLSEVPLFVDSRATRLIQLADLVAYSIFRSFERGDDRFLPLFKHRFEQDALGSSLVPWLVPPGDKITSAAVVSTHSTTISKENGTVKQVEVIEEVVAISAEGAPAKGQTLP